MRESPTSDHTYSPAGLRPGEGRSRELQFEGLGSHYGGAGRVEGCAGSGKADPRVLAVSSGARYKSMSPARLPISRSPCITIPPGLSPTTLLESPVLLTGVKAEPSPTTGTFCMLSNLCRTVGSIKVSSPRNISNFREYEEGSCADFEFRPHVRTSSGAAPATDNLASVGTKQYKYNGIVQDIRQSNDLTLSLSPTSANEVVSFTAGVYNKAASSEPQQERDSQKEIQPSHTDHAGSDPVTGVGKTSEDGYNWRKYGQKLVKGSEFPRSYYKCTHPKCQVKKQLERSHDGQITDIIYKGRHDHPKPQPNRRLASDTALSCQEEEKIDGFTEDPGGPAELSPISVSEDDTEGTVVPSNINGDDVVDNNDPESKKRKIDASSIDMSAMGKTTREPRVVVQTLSEVDILDDGYRWRKYGQKVVKGNPNPRSYYKCTNVGCPVRKHVERASHDPKAVITTYEGKHNHDVPATRTNSHEFTVPMTINSSGAHSSQKAVTFSAPRIYDTPRAITQHYSHSESDVISLDLAVGLSPRHKERANDKMQTTETGNIHAASSAHHTLVMHAAPVASYYGNASSGMGYFRPRGETIESFSFSNPPLNHSTKAYPASMGSLLTGP